MDIPRMKIYDFIINKLPFRAISV